MYHELSGLLLSGPPCISVLYARQHKTASFSLYRHILMMMTAESLLSKRSVSFFFHNLHSQFGLLIL